MNDFDKILKQKLEGYTEIPPESVFENVCKNIPKRTFGDIVMAHKYLLVSVAAAVAVATAVVLVALPNNEDAKNISNTPIENITPDAPEANQPGTDLFVSTLEETAAPLPSGPKVSELITQSENKIDALNLNDTIICGNELLIEGIDATKIKASKGLNLTKVASGVKLGCTVYGTHTIELVGGSNVKITFVEPEKLVAVASKTDLCFGEKLLVDVSGVAPSVWNDDDYSVKKLGGSKYELSGLRSGRSNIVMATSGKCATQVALEVNVAEKLNYSVSTKADYCSAGNGQISVKASSTVNYFKVNESRVSRSGIFSELKAGTYTLEINYANSCIARDTVVVKDNANINASFESSKDAFNDKAYSFRNYTRVEDSGNAQNVDYEWLVNGMVITTDYNFDYEFKSSGKYVVELVARVGDCESRHSETVVVTSSNFRIPNVFTPNGDGIGDEFTIMYNGTLFDYDLSIYTKSGQLIFHSQQLDKCWDGKISGNNDASEGVYFYVITATDENNEKLTQKGTVQLVRQ